MGMLHWLWHSALDLGPVENRRITITYGRETDPDARGPEGAAWIDESANPPRVTIDVVVQVRHRRRSLFGGAIRQRWLDSATVVALKATDSRTGQRVVDARRDEAWSVARPGQSEASLIMAAFRATAMHDDVMVHLAGRAAEQERRQRAMARWAEIAGLHYHPSDVPRIMAMLERHQVDRENPGNTKPIRRLFERLDDADDADRPVLVGRYLGLKEQAADARDHPEPVPGDGRLG